MPTLEDILGKTMLFTAAKTVGIDPWAHKVGANDPVNCPAPTFNAATDPKFRPIWQWTHDPSAPQKITDLTALVRPPLANGAADPKAGAMAMPVCPRIEALSAKVTLGVGQTPVDLPLTSQYVVAKFFLPTGRVQGGSMFAHVGGWWRLESQVDASILVVFAYELVFDGSGGPPKQVTLGQLEESIFPIPAVDKNDPDYVEGSNASSSANAPASAAGTPGAPQTIQTTVTVVPPPTYVVVAFSVTTCKQASDFEPGGVLGAGRVYPHVMILCTQGIAAAEATIAVDRPAKEVMKHDPEMMDDIGPLFVADTNTQRNFFGSSTLNLGAPPLPVWSNFFDYWDSNPPTGVAYKMVDPTKGQRTVTGAIQRERSTNLMRRWGIYESSSDFDKLAGQGAYDNLHIAPRMKFTSKDPTGPTIPNIVMAPFCIHDCFHTHTRWGTLNGGLPESNQGFSGRIPYQVSGAPLVPGNQTVWISLTKTGSTTGFEYRGIQAGTILPGTWSVINHHGSAYALEVTGTILVSIARRGVWSLVQGFHEPYTSPDLASDGAWDVDDVDPTVSWAAFYQRLQYTGDASTNTWEPRIKILDLAKCRNG